MLANLLPGLRELRAPLAAGYLWLAAIWIEFSGRVPDAGRATGVVAAAYRFDDAASPAGVAAVVTFAAFIGGTISVAISSRASRRSVLDTTYRAGFALRLWIDERFGDAERVFRELRADEIEAWRDTWHREYVRGNDYVDRTGIDLVWALMEHFPRHVDPADRPRALNDQPSDFTSFLVRRIWSERDRIKIRLLGEETDRDLYQAIDRAEAEAEFRFAVACAAVPLILVVAGGFSWRGVVFALATIPVAAVVSRLVIQGLFLPVVRRMWEGVVWVVDHTWLGNNLFLEPYLFILQRELWAFHFLLAGVTATLVALSYSRSEAWAVLTMSGGGVLCVALWVQGAQAMYRANTYLADALILDRVRAPSVEAVEALEGESAVGD